MVGDPALSHPQHGFNPWLEKYHMPWVPWGKKEEMNG